MRIALLILFISILKPGFSQDDEYPDYRSKKDIFTRVVEKDIRSDIASFSMGGIDESMGKLPLKTVPATGYGSNFVSFSDNNIEVKITSVPFDATKHKLGYFENKYLVKIDNKPYFGDYGKVPKTMVGDVMVIVNKDTIPVPATAYNDLANPILSVNEKGVQKSSDKVFLSADGKKIYIYMLKTERGGSYEVTWVIQDKKYYRRVVDFGFLK